MTAPDLIDRLAAHRTVGTAPREQLEWLAAHGELRRFSRGEIVIAKGLGVEELKGSALQGLWIVLSGHFSISINRGGGPRKVMDWRGGDLGGVLPYSRMTASPGDVIVEEPTEVLLVGRDRFPDMIRTCYELTAICVHVMLDRARIFTSTDLHVEKLTALGKIAAQLAHELNNPASAVARSAKALTNQLSEMEAAFRALGAAGLSDAELDAIDRARTVCVSGVVDLRSPIEQTDREDSLAVWLEEHDADVTSAAALADTAVTLGQLDELAAALSGDRLDLVLQSIVADCATRKLAAEIEVAASRIHGLVTAVKGLVFLDQAAAPKPVHIGQGLADTLVVLRGQARAKSIGVTIRVEPDLPAVLGLGGELNQVWLNLIDNALYAAPRSGHVEVTASRQDDSVIVRVVDDGPGIAPEMSGRLFEPFSTNKPEGEGTGQGLAIARQIVKQHRGDIAVESRPGRTEFRVTIPITGVQ